MTNVVTKCHQQHLDLLCFNYASFLPLPKKLVPLQTYTKFLSKAHIPRPKAHCSRIKNRRDLFESDSDSEAGAAADDVTCPDGAAGRDGSEPSQSKENSGFISENNKNDDVVRINADVTSAKKKRLSKQSELLVRSLSSLAELSDTMSYCDSYLTLGADSCQSNDRPRPYDSFNQCELTSGYSDEPIIDEDTNVWKYRCADEISSYVRCGTISLAQNRLNALCSDVDNLSDDTKKSELTEKLTLPVDDVTGQLRVSELTPVQQR